MLKFFGKFRRSLGVGAILLGLFAFQLHAHGQGKGTCRVKVVDDQGPLPGAAVVVKGTSNGQAVDNKGVCTMTSLPDKAALVVSCLGYDDTEVVWNGRQDMTVKMKSSSQMMDETVVVGYGTQRKKDLSGAITQVKGDVLNEYSTLSVANALQGRVAGVEISQLNGQPGAGMQVRIR